MKVSRSLAISKVARCISGGVCGLAILLLWLFVPRAAQAADFPVNNTADTNSSGTLRFAINQANNTAGADTISFDLGGPAIITLTSDLPAITQTLTISGPGTDNLIINGDEQFRAISITHAIPVTITNLTIQAGRAISGGAIYARGPLTLDSVHLYNNQAVGAGGALYITGTTVSILASQIYSNSAGNHGGGIYLFSGKVAIQQTDLYSNTAGSGGGVFVRSPARLDMVGGEIHHNTVSGDGAGINVGGTAYLTGTKFLSNTSAGDGGAIAQTVVGTVQATDGCFVGNSNIAVSYLNGTPPLVATDNWWGFPNGPSENGPGWGDSVSANVIFSDTKTIAPIGCPDLTPQIEMAKSVQGIPAPGDKVTYTLVISNSGLTDDPNVIVTDTLPAELIFASWLEQPAGANQSNDETAFSGVITAGKRITMSFAATFVGDYSDVVLNTALYSGTFEVDSAQAAFAATHLLTVTKSGSGFGTVSSTPSGISCGGDCSEDYAPGTVVTLTAVPDISSTFTGWSGACSGDDECVVTMDAAKQVTTTFMLKSYSLTVTKNGTGTGSVTSSPTGINCGGDCTQIYTHGVTVTLTPIADGSSTFTSWSGACSGSGPCIVTMTAARHVTATFTIKSYALTIAKNGNGSGSVTSNPVGINCGGDCSQNYTHSTLVTLTPIANANSTFTGWGGECSDVGNCAVTMNAAKQATATFALKSYALTVTKDGAGAGVVTSTPAGINCGGDCSQSYTHDTLVMLTAAPNAGSLFDEWGGACSGSYNCIVTVDAAKTVTATFALDYTITNLEASNDGPTLLGTPTHFNASASGIAITYSWDFGDTLTGTGANPSHTYAFPGEYIAAVTASNNGDSATRITIVTVNEPEEPLPPQAVNDAAATIENTILNGNALANDEDPQESALTIVDYDQPAHGTVTIANNGDFTYIPLTGYVGVDFFSYTAGNSYNLTARAMVVVVVEPMDSSAAQPTLIVTTAGVTTTQAFKDGDFTLSLQTPAAAYSGTLNAQDVLFLVYTPLLTTTADLDAAPGTLRFGGILFSLSIYLNNSLLNHHQFDPPLRLEITYPTAALAGLDLDDLTLLYWNPTSSDWSVDGIDVVTHNLATRRIELAIYHLTDYALFSAPANQNFMPFLTKVTDPNP